jgi:molecular chaperone DnaK
MVKDAEEHASEDKRRRELVEARNQGEALIHATEKSVKEYGEKIPEGDKQAIETASDALRQALAGEDVETIKARTTDLMQAPMKLGEAMYAAAQAATAGPGDGDQGGAGGAETGPKKDDVIDADFQEVDDHDKKKRA